MYTESYDMESGSMSIYVDGKQEGQKILKPRAVRMADADIKIGKGMNRRPTNPVRANTFSDSYGFDGLIDEVKIYNSGIVFHGSNGGPTPFTDFHWKIRESADMKQRSLPLFNIRHRNSEPPIPGSTFMKPGITFGGSANIPMYWSLLMNCPPILCSGGGPAIYP